MTSCTPTTVTTGERGFTLIELIAVLVLVGILLAFTPSGLQALIPERELNAEVGRLRATLEALMAQTILDQASYAMHYDTDNLRRPSGAFFDGPHREIDQPVGLADQTGGAREGCSSIARPSLRVRSYGAARGDCC